MITRFIDYFTKLGLETEAAGWAGMAAGIAGLLVISLIAYLLARFVLLRLLSFYIRSNRFQWDNRFLERKVFHRLCHLVPSLLLYTFSFTFGDFQPVVQRFAAIYIIVVVILTLDALLNAVDDIYNSFEVARKKPIKGYLQGIKVFIFVIGAIIAIAQLIGKSPVLLLSGIGAMMAVVLLIFQDSILGFVAGIQLAANDMVRIGDWIEMPKYNADGDVVDISLTTIKVANFDRTITTIPPHALVKDSFRNWRGMVEAGGRRIKRSIYIDTGSIRFCTDAMLARFRSIHLIKGYINERQAEIDAYNQEHGIDVSEMVNGRHMTNIETFRVYIQQYLRSHPHIHQNMIQMVRQLPPGEHGLPIEIYAFAATTDWVVYEGIQADIFDHVMAVAPRFGLQIFQEPGGHDLRAALGATAGQPGRCTGSSGL
ncbi:MAG: mechanosensitive ion channel family protein [Bacillota bacterium]|nr:mechanosensitive ion channel family protein [Bacillota bacterium]